MSKKIYSVLESVDPGTGKWEVANLYQKYDNDTYGLAQLIRGDSESYQALFGDEPFDSIFAADGEIIDNLVDPVERIESIISDATCFYIPPNASKAAQEFYEKFGISGGSDKVCEKQYPECAVYTLRDLDLIEVLAKGASAKALRFYNRHFARIRWLLDSIRQMQYLTNGADVRAIMWGG